MFEKTKKYDSMGESVAWGGWVGKLEGRRARDNAKHHKERFDKRRVGEELAVLNDSQKVNICCRLRDVCF